ncbi:SMI1/KNR4 family protein [Streptomyces sp. AD55]|uniref:SMI1/KNR4 family protein n=1 Tax=Streptomyces sp. AD55 TaxID=3242895 RepID=UPI0035285509
MTDTTGFDWRSYLLRWSEEWVDSRADEEERPEGRWLGFPGASEERIVAMEKRLGRRMPPSYRAFLKVSDGWWRAGGFVWLLAGTADAHWHDDAYGFASKFAQYLDEDAGPGERREAEIWRTGLRLDVESDAVHVLMDPEDADEDGEWAVYTWAGWRAAPPVRYANFLEFMRDMHREFHLLRAAGETDGGPVFVNETTRTLDARVEQARLEALRGDWERALKALDEAKEYGRPRAAGLGDQVRGLLGNGSTVRFQGLVTDPRYAPDLLPPLIAAHAAHSQRDAAPPFGLAGADDAMAATVRALLDQMWKGTYRHTAPGPFGEAVDRARELARWGDGDGAWRTLMGAVPRWEPLGPDHLAPLGWLADPLLGPLLTPERGRELLSIPRGGQSGRVPAPAPAADPGGLAWLAEPAPGNHLTSYRFVLVEGAEPEELPGLLSDGDAVLSEPLSLREARMRQRPRQRAFAPWEERALVAVGRAGPGWSFAFDGEPFPFDGRPIVSPVAGAGPGVRAVVVWGGLKVIGRSPFFHLSVTEGGVERYAFTYEDGAVRRSGRIPEALDPDHHFGDAKDAADVAGAKAAEGALLAAVAGEFGVGLPRHALTRGRLHTFTTRAWTLPANGAGAYAVARIR